MLCDYLQSRLHRSKDGEIMRLSLVSQVTHRDEYFFFSSAASIAGVRLPVSQT
jgi:hypothetical protein